jgi:hypothetical protein
MTKSDDRFFDDEVTDGDLEEFLSGAETLAGKSLRGLPVVRVLDELEATGCGTGGHDYRDGACVSCGLPLMF